MQLVRGLFNYWTCVCLVFVVLVAFEELVNYAMATRPLDEQFAYEALVRQLRLSTATGQQVLSLSPTTMLNRGREVLFFGEGSVNGANRNKYAVTVQESMQFEYIVVITAQCEAWDSACYRVGEMQVTARKNILPMI